MKSALSHPLVLLPSILAGAFILYLGQLLFVPLFMGLLIAMILFPFCKMLEQKHWPRSLSISLGLLIITALFSLLVWILVLQLSAFLDDLPQLKAQLKPSFVQFQIWVQDTLGFTIDQQSQWLDTSGADLSHNIIPFLQAGLGQTMNLVFMLLTVPVFAALFLYNRETFVHFLEQLFKNNVTNLKRILAKTVHTYYQFIKGMVLVYLVVGLLNSIGLMALGVEHAFLFGMLTAIMTIIPYIGIIISAAVPISVAWIDTGAVWVPMAIVALFAFVQYLEANIIFPKIVGTQLNVNTWSVLVAILAGAVIWGVAGMILFIPFVAVLKIVSDEIPSMKALNILLSNSTGKSAAGNVENINSVAMVREPLTN